jgi:nucleoside phosphorylase
MLGIVFATTAEAQSFLEKYERGRFDGLSEGESQNDDQCLISIVGIGKIKATLRTERLLRQTRLKRLIHVGTCTSLIDDLDVGTVVAASQAFEGDRIELAAPTYPRMPLSTPFEDLKQVTLVTQDHTVQGASELSYWQRIADISDMTGYAVAYVAATHGVPCNIVKVVSGHMGVEDKQLRKTLAASYNTLADFLTKRLEGLFEEE